MSFSDKLSSRDFYWYFSEAYQRRLQKLIILQKVDSTNNFLLGETIPERSNAIVCMTEQQTAGKGTKGRAWQSEIGASFIYSIAYVFDDNVLDLSALSLAIGLIVQQTLDDCGFAGVQLKWPNDLIHNQKKLGGVLVEVKKSNHKLHLVCGIGINIKNNLDASKIDQPFTSLMQIAKHEISRNQLAAQLTEGLLNLFSLYPKHGFHAWQEKWQAVHANQNKKIRIMQSEKMLLGVARGVDEYGALLLETENGLQKIISADVFSL